MKGSKYWVWIACVCLISVFLARRALQKYMAELPGKAPQKVQEAKNEVAPRPQQDTVVRIPPTALMAPVPRQYLRVQKPGRKTGSKKAQPFKIDSDVPQTRRDTIPPYVYARPAGGRYDRAIKVHLMRSEPCTIYHRRDSEDDWRVYQKALKIEEETTLEFYAVDLAGNRSNLKSREYRILAYPKGKCLQRMIPVKSGKNSWYCMDEYEWPNHRAAKPLDYVSYHAARDSCLSKGKRLCTSQEWYYACAGPYARAYAYGTGYEAKACNTEGGKVASSGRYEECRSYFGAMDMSGNLREWTSTPAPEKPRFRKVHGGFYGSHSQSKCEGYQYSFYLQNRHHGVGFRCCSDARN